MSNLKATGYQTEWRPKVRAPQSSLSNTSLKHAEAPQKGNLSLRSPWLEPSCEAMPEQQLQRVSGIVCAMRLTLRMIVRPTTFLLSIWSGYFSYERNWHDLAQVQKQTARNAQPRTVEDTEGPFTAGPCTPQTTAKTTLFPIHSHLYIHTYYISVLTYLSRSNDVARSLKIYWVADPENEPPQLVKCFPSSSPVAPTQSTRTKLPAQTVIVSGAPGSWAKLAMFGINRTEIISDGLRGTMKNKPEEYYAMPGTSGLWGMARFGHKSITSYRRFAS
ncbi:hypothetical protein DFH05DRAFT_1460565 [Lentinula detonsa]|uniref:Uncharacterized protein n=1 Tax=Lentinula detonsa TaxID=2804962 RepID=A0A9W8P0Z2_9AGAR|nr:hypothetical protein DFH05DRAFT_1460565 [Lentinula detonsa]